ncbi:MAG TPA: histidine kinase [Aggregatilineaceae bacterium]|nr:histidine kinase [Aggregatilineaceae bacterium]
MSASSAVPVHRLDKALFWLRWLFLAGLALLAVLAEEAVLGDGTLDRGRLTISLSVGAGFNLLLGILSLSRGVSDRTLGVLSILLDSMVATLFFWVYEGAIPPLLILGGLVVVAAAFRFGWRGIVLAVILLAVFSLLVVGQLRDLDSAQLADWAVSLALLLVFGALGVVLRSGGGLSSRRLSIDEREAEAQRLRSTRERARAIFEMANTLSATLDHRRVLEEAQNLGTLSLCEDLEPESRLISAVLLFQGKDNKLRVVTSRGLTRADDAVAVPGRRGVLGLALKGDVPVFAGDAMRDPELRYFVAFQEAKAVLAIPLRAGFDVYGVMVFGSTQPSSFSDDHVELMSAIGTQATLSLQNAVLYQNLRVEKERIVDVEEDARKKLARDLHDGPTQSVAAIAMRVNYIRRLIERQPQQALEELWKVEDLARRTTKEIRHMLFTLRPLVLETQGLLPALRQLAEKMKDTYDLTVTIEGQPDVESFLDINGQGVLFYIIEEAVNNARKHAQSDEIWVRLYRQEGMIATEIEDHGVGFDVEAVDASYDRRGSLGMINMRERAEIIEGTLRIESAKGQGTKITVLIPARSAGSPGGNGESTQPTEPLQLQSSRAAAHPAASESPPAPEASGQPQAEPPASISRPTRPKPLTRLQPEKPVAGPSPSHSGQSPDGQPAPPSSQDRPSEPVRPSSLPRPQSVKSSAGEASVAAPEDSQPASPRAKPSSADKPSSAQPE